MAPPCHCSLLKWSSVTGYVREYFLLKTYLYKYETDNEPERGIEKNFACGLISVANGQRIT